MMGGGKGESGLESILVSFADIAAGKISRSLHDKMFIVLLKPMYL